jgi:hypothetical protein
MLTGMDLCATAVQMSADRFFPDEQAAVVSMIADSAAFREAAKAKALAASGADDAEMDGEGGGTDTRRGTH